MLEKSYPKNIATLYSLRKATVADVDFLFNVSTSAMRPVVERLNPDKQSDRQAEFKAYQDKFAPAEIEIIQHQDFDVGRLRIVRSVESIYIGGIQILPEFQNKGIGTAIFTDLILESKRTGVPILLEVHEVNVVAMSFYKGLGFDKTEQKEGKLSMQYSPE